MPSPIERDRRSVNHGTLRGDTGHTTVAGEGIRARLVVLRPQHADGSLSRIVLDQVMADLVHEHIEAHEIAQCLAGPRDDRLRAPTDHFDGGARARESLRFGAARRPGSVHGACGCA